MDHNHDRLGLATAVALNTLGRERFCGAVRGHFVRQWQRRREHLGACTRHNSYTHIHTNTHTPPTQEGGRERGRNTPTHTETDTQTDGCILTHTFLDNKRKTHTGMYTHTQNTHTRYRHIDRHTDRWMHAYTHSLRQPNCDPVCDAFSAVKGKKFKDDRQGLKIKLDARGLLVRGPRTPIHLSYIHPPTHHTLIHPHIHTPTHLSHTRTAHHIPAACRY